MHFDGRTAALVHKDDYVVVVLPPPQLNNQQQQHGNNNQPLGRGNKITAAAALETVELAPFDSHLTQSRGNCNSYNHERVHVNSSFHLGSRAIMIVHHTQQVLHFSC